MRPSDVFFLTQIALAMQACTYPTFRFVAGDGSTDGGSDVVDDVPTTVDTGYSLLSPLSGTTVGTDQPELRWTGTVAASVSEVQLCETENCTGRITSVSGTTQGSPATALTPGKYYWRIVDSMSRALTPTWRFRVQNPVMERGLTRAHGVGADFDGDDHGEFFASSQLTSGTGTDSIVFRYVLGYTLPEATMIEQFSAPVASELGASVAAVGDVNGDGADDWAIGAPGEDSGAGVVELHFGTSGGRPALAKMTVRAVGNDRGFGRGLAAAGDLDQDGFGDFLVVAPGNDPARSPAVVYGGSTPGRVQGSINSHSAPFQIQPAVLGDIDLDGDGAVEAVAAYADDTNTRGSLMVYQGGPLGIAQYSQTDCCDESVVQFGASLTSLGDINGDGKEDLAVGAPGNASSAGAVFVFLGVAGRTPLQRGVVLRGMAAGDRFGAAIVCEDFDYDGHGDLVIGAPGASTVYLAAGMAGGTFASPVAIPLASAAPGIGATLRVRGRSDFLLDQARWVVAGTATDNFVVVIEAIGVAPLQLSERYRLMAPTGSTGFGRILGARTGWEPPFLAALWGFSGHQT